MWDGGLDEVDGKKIGIMGFGNRGGGRGGMGVGFGLDVYVYRSKWGMEVGGDVDKCG